MLNNLYFDRTAFMFDSHSAAPRKECSFGKRDQKMILQLLSKISITLGSQINQIIKYSLEIKTIRTMFFVCLRERERGTKREKKYS